LETVFRPNLRSEIYDILKELIVTWQVRPGEKINEEALAKSMGVSRTPIREALCRLENEGLVSMIPRRGAYVIQLSEEKVIETLQVRGVLEGLVARLAAEKMDQSALENIKGVLDPLLAEQKPDDRPLDYTAGDIAFHAMVLDASKNDMLRSMMDIVNVHLQLIRLRTVMLPGRAKKTVREHYEVLEAIERTDPDGAEEAMRRHIESVKDDAMRYIDKMV
jgi:DNA-binding GntR family transcriptional regulator